MRFNKLNDLVGWGVFLIAALVYLLTIEPTVSYWDCGEYIAIAYKLEIGHPPGAPFFMLVARIFSAFVDKESVAMMVNSMSALCSAFGILFLFWSITAFARRFAEKSKEELDFPQQLAVLASGFIGAMAFTFTDTFWFSAVEGEVYAMSAMFTAAVFWLILKWERRADEPHSDRYIILISFVIGLSIGVHLMNILAIPAIALVYYFRKYQTTPKGILLTLIISGAIIIAFQAIVITGFFELAGWFERMMVNSFGAPFNLGAAIYFIALFAALAYGLYYTHRYVKPLGNMILLSLTVILIGYSSYATILIRSAADPPIDENNPENLLTLVSYLKREQYGSRPIFFGQYWNAPTMGTEEQGKNYMKAYQIVPERGGDAVRIYQDEYDAKRYVQEHSDRNLKIHPAYVAKKARSQRIFHDKWTVPFQRMYDSRHGSDYKNWIDEDQFEQVTYTDRRGRQQKKARPQWWQNLDFYFEYQLGWMYWRYFLWNYAGRQNDVQGFAGSIVEGNWLSGIDFIDRERIGSQENLPPLVSENPAYNKFYYLPIVLGLIGFFFQLARSPRHWSVVLMLFIITGIAIVTYLNQPPAEPRERDYTNVGSFWAFAIWIGLGVYALFDAARNIRMPQLREILTWGGVPVGAVLLFSLLLDTGKAFAYSLAFLFVVAFLAVGVMYLIGQNVQNRYAHVLLALLIGAPVPYVLAKDGWDDHDRSGRYTARDFAKNYLASCEENAILFTNGDNDTFPLWYVQEVEEFRTDVRVVNLSLLNTDWYINQMARKAYDSDALPFGVHSRKYRQGTRDIVPLFNLRSGDGDRQTLPERDNAAKKILDRYGSDAFRQDTSGNFYLNIEAAVDYVMNDENKRNIFSRDEKHAYFPAKRFFLDVPKQKIIEKGIVPEEDEDKIVDEIRWRVGRNQLTKNNVMVLSLLANFDWDRPIYWSVTVGGNATLGLKNYLQLEGLGNRLVPVKGSSNAPAVQAAVHTEKMYHNLMNEFEWGNMNGEEWIYMDDDNRRMTRNMRMQFANLAAELTQNGKKDSAQKALQECIDVMPRRTVPYDPGMVLVVREMMRADMGDEADRVARDLFDRYEKSLNYYKGLSQEYMQYQQVNRKMGESVRVLRNLQRFASQFGRDSLQQEFSQRWQDVSQGLQQPGMRGPEQQRRRRAPQQRQRAPQPR